MKNHNLAQLVKRMEQKGGTGIIQDVELLPVELADKVFGGGNKKCTCTNSGCSC